MTRTEVLLTQMALLAKYAEVEAMKAANIERERQGLALAYGEEQFMAISDKLELFTKELAEGMQF